jgi:hypothetical protein
VSRYRFWRNHWFSCACGAAGISLTLLCMSCALPGGSGAPTTSHGSSAHAICNRGTYVHIPGDFPEYGPPQTLYVGTTPDGHGSVFRVQAPAASVTYFYAAGAGQVNYVFHLQTIDTDGAHLLWREQSDFNCRGTMTVQTDPADGAYTIYSAEPSDAAYAYPSASP